MESDFSINDAIERKRKIYFEKVRQSLSKQIDQIDPKLSNPIEKIVWLGTRKQLEALFNYLECGKKKFVTAEWREMISDHFEMEDRKPIFSPFRSTAISSKKNNPFKWRGLGNEFAALFKIVYQNGMIDNDWAKIIAPHFVGSQGKRIKNIHQSADGRSGVLRKFIKKTETDLKKLFEEHM